MKRFFLISVIFGTLLYSSCSVPTTPDKGGEPTPPSWVDLSVNKTGSIKTTFIIKGLGDKMPIFYDSVQNTKDTLNYIRISFNPDPGGERFTIMSRDTTWEGKVSFMDTITLNTQFKPTKTPYWTTDGYREFNWFVNILIGFFYQDPSNNLIAFWGNLNPSLKDAPYATLYINTNSGDTFLRIHAPNK